MLSYFPFLMKIIIGYLYTIIQAKIRERERYSVEKKNVYFLSCLNFCKIIVSMRKENISINLIKIIWLIHNSIIQTTSLLEANQIFQK